MREIRHTVCSIKGICEEFATMLLDIGLYDIDAAFEKK